MRIAIFGDIHGHWIAFRDKVQEIHDKTALDLVLQCGDAQPFRTEADLEYMQAPVQYHEMGDFYKFYEGEETFPVPCYIIGGNHEPWNWLDQLQDTEQLAPNINFLGRAKIRKIQNIHVAGLSGIYSPKYFHLPHLEWPYHVTTRKRAIYYNEEDIEKLIDSSITLGQPDILILHEWPDLIHNNTTDNFPEHCKRIGSSVLSDLIDLLEPRWCFCGHMHHPFKHKHGQTDLICLSHLHLDPENAWGILDTDNNTFILGEDKEWNMNNEILL